MKKYTFIFIAIFAFVSLLIVGTNTTLAATQKSAEKSTEKDIPKIATSTRLIPPNLSQKPLLGTSTRPTQTFPQNFQPYAIPINLSISGRGDINVMGLNAKINSDKSLTATTTINGKPVTFNIFTNASTTVFIANAPSSLSKLPSGSIISARGTFNGFTQSGISLTASEIRSFVILAPGATSSPYLNNQARPNFPNNQNYLKKSVFSRLWYFLKSPFKLK